MAAFTPTLGSAAAMTVLSVAGFAAAATCLAGASWAQGPPQSTEAGPTYEVVSIKRNTAGILGGSPPVERPDGGFTLTNVPVGTLIGRAYGTIPLDIEGLPAWTSSERYDVSATSPLTRATPEDRSAMLRAMLADRFRLVARGEKRVIDAYDLVLARSDGRLGPGLKPGTPDLDCAARAEAQRAAREAAIAAGNPPPRPEFPDRTGPVPPCTFRITGTRLEGEQQIANFAFMLRPTTGRPVIDKTGLKGGYHISIDYDRMAGQRGPEVAPNPDGPPSIFTAVLDQLGLKLQPSKTERSVLVIERLERPSEN